MRISLLREREDFEAIFSQSLQSYFDVRFNASISTRWSGNHAGDFICNDFLNILFHRKISTRLLDNFTQEFRYQANPIRRFAQTAYVSLACRKGVRRLTCRRRLEISPTITESKNWVFIPGNHSIRYIDLNKQRSCVFPKTGFRTNFLEAEINNRINHASHIAPKILDRGSKNEWFEEEIVTGLPHNRLSQVHEREQLLSEAKNGLFQIYQKTTASQSASEHFNLLRSRLQTCAATLEDKISIDSTAILLQTIKLAGKAIQSCKTARIMTVLSHGDFQPANALLTKERSYLIDWEYSAQRSCFYDALTWHTQARSHAAFPAAFERILKELAGGKHHYSWTGHTLDRTNLHYLWLFLLEDLLVKLEEIDSPMIRQKELSIGPYLSSLPRACDLLTRF